MNPNARTTEIATLIARLAELMTEDRQTTALQPPARQMPERVLLTTEEAAEQLGIGRTLMYKLIRTGDIESVAIGRLRRIHIDAVKGYAAQLVAKQNAA